MKINLLPFIIEAFGTNKKTKKPIDNLYEKNKLRFYTLAKNNEFYNHSIITEGDIYREVYGKKALGIILDSTKNEETTTEVLKIIKKGWPYIYSYINQNETIDFNKFTMKYLCSRELSDDEFNSEITILYWLAVIFNKKPAMTEDNKEFINHLENSLLGRLFFYDDSQKLRFGYKTFKKPFIEKIKSFRSRVAKEYMDVKTYDDLFFNKQDSLERNFLDSLSFIVDAEKMSLSSLVGDIKLTDKEIDEIYAAYYSVYKNQNRKKGYYFVINGIILRSLIKAYKDVKEFFFKNNTETVLLEMKRQDDTIQKLKHNNEYLENKLKNTKHKLEDKQKELEQKYIDTIQKLRKENQELEKVLNKEKQKDKELFALRELMFSLDEQIKYQKPINNVDLTAVNGLVVGGHDKWQQRMKELLPSFDFLHINNENFDEKILDNIDVIFFCINYLSHSLYYKVINIARNKNIEIDYLNYVNEEKVINKIKNKVMALNDEGGRNQYEN